MIIEYYLFENGVGHRVERNSVFFNANDYIGLKFDFWGGEAPAIAECEIDKKIYRMVDGYVEVKLGLGCHKINVYCGEKKFHCEDLVIDNFNEQVGVKYEITPESIALRDAMTTMQKQFIEMQKQVSTMLTAIDEISQELTELRAFKAKAINDITTLYDCYNSLLKDFELVKEEQAI